LNEVAVEDNADDTQETEDDWSDVSVWAAPHWWGGLKFACFIEVTLLLGCESCLCCYMVVAGVTRCWWLLGVDM
jgi:hypothetical protein